MHVAPGDVREVDATVVVVVVVVVAATVTGE